MTKITDGISKRVTEIVPINENRPLVADFDGNDAMMKDTLQLKSEIVQFANAALPECLRKALYIVSHGKSAKEVIEAAKFIKLIADGTAIPIKTVSAVAKKLSDDQINSLLQQAPE